MAGTTRQSSFLEDQTQARQSLGAAGGEGLPLGPESAEIGPQPPELAGAVATDQIPQSGDTSGSARFGDQPELADDTGFLPPLGPTATPGQSLRTAEAQAQSSISTDKADYAPGETVWITASDFTVGSTVRFSVADDPLDVGDDGDRDIYPSFEVTDGGEGDLDGEANGVIRTSWLVPSDDDRSGGGVPDALNATLFLSAQGIGTGDRATTVFTDSAPPNPAAYTAIVSNQKAGGGITAWDPTLGSVGDWRNGAVSGVYSEGSSVAFKAEFAGLTVGSLYYIDLSIDIIGDSGGSFGFTSFKPIGWRFPATYANKFPSLTGYVAEDGSNLDTATFLGQGLSNLYSSYLSFNGQDLTYRVYFTASSATGSLIYGAEFAAAGLSIDPNVVGRAATGYAGGLPSEVPVGQGAKTVNGNFGVGTANFGNETLSFSGGDLVGTLIWPLTDDKSIATPEDISVSIALTGSDPNNDNDPTTTDVPGRIDYFRIKSLPLNGTLYTTRTADGSGGFMYSGSVDVEGLVAATSNAASLWFVPVSNWSGSTSFQYAAIDNDRLEDKTPATVTIAVAPVDDPPLAGDDTATAVEQGGLANGSGGSNPTGNVLTNDADIDSLSAVLSVAAISGAAVGVVGGVTSGSYGTLTLNSNGGFSYTLNNSNASVQALNVGGTLTDVFTYTLTDGTNTDLATLTITINGSNDAPVATADTGSAAEQGGVSNGTGGTAASGNVLGNDSDVDNSAVQLVVSAISGSSSGTVGGATTGSYGTLSLSSNGNYVYTIDNNNASVQALNVGGTLIDTFSYTVSDGQGGGATATLRITINGADDLPSILGDASGIAIEKGGVANASGGSSATGNLDFTDVDDPGTVDSWIPISSATISANGYGNYTITSAGIWTYGLDDSHPTVQALNVGQSLSDSFTVTTAGGTSKVVTITILGANDAAVISGIITGSVTEAGGVANGTAGTPIASADLLASDVDNVSDGWQAVATATSSTGGYGTYTATANGVWAYTLNNNHPAVQALDVGETLTDSFTLSTIDGTSQVVSITVVGSNDAPTLGAVSGGTIAEVSQSSSTTDSGLSGTLVGADVDVEGLVYGISGGTVSGSTVSKAGSFGSLSLDISTGVYSYSKNAGAIEALDATETGSDVFTFTVSDGDGALVSQGYMVTVSGADDAPTLGAVSGGTIAEVSQSSSTTDSGLSGTLVGADVDVEGLVYGISGGTVSGSTVSKAGSFGTLTVNTTTGAYSYSKNSGAIEALSALQAGSDVFIFTVSDGDGALVTQAYSVSIAGANDSPTVSAVIDVSGAVSEVVDGAPGENSSNRSDSGSFSIADVDLADLQSVLVTASGTTAPGGTVRGSLTAAVADNTTGDGNGTVTWTYQVADSLLDNLAGGQSFTESFTISVADGKGGTVNQVVAVVATGSNDAPDTGVSSASGLDNASWIAVVLNGSDLDGTVTSFEIQTLPALGVLYANQADAVAGINALSTNGIVAASGNSATLYFVPVIGSAGTTSFQYAAIDAQGAKDATSATATISVALSNLAPSTSAVSAAGLEDAASIAITLSGADSDGTVSSFRITSTAANGKLYADSALATLLSTGSTVSASGSSAPLYFVPDANWNGSTSFAYAAVDDDGAEDATPATATITVSAVNDPPNGTDGAISSAEDTAWITVVLAATDVDSAVSSYRITALPSASLGTLYRSASATATNAVALNEVRSAAANGTLTLSFKPATNASGSTSLSFVAIDASGLEDPTPATTTIMVTEVNDAPVPANETLTAWFEDGGLRTIAFTQLLANDNPGPNEASQTLTITSLGSVVGGTAVLVDTDGNGTNDAVQFSPTANFAGAASIDYILRDNGTTNGLSDPKTATGRASFTITQVNDAPSFVKGADQVVLEDAAPVTVNGWAAALNDGDSQVAQTLSFVIDSNSNPGLFRVAPSVSTTGVLTYTPATNAFGSADITIRLTDNGGTANGGDSDSDPQTFTISVTPVNDAPVALDVASPSYLPDPHSDVWALSTSTIARGLITAEWFIANDRSTPGSGVVATGTPSFVLKATDVDGTAVRFQFNALPASDTGTLYFDNGSGSPDLSAPVQAGVSFAGTFLGGVWQTQLHFVPGSAWTGSADLQYNAIDAGGLSSTALVSIGEPLLSVVAVRGLPAGLTANYDGQGRLIDISGDISALTTTSQTYLLQYDLSDGKSIYQDISAYFAVFPAGAGANLVSLNTTTPETSNGNYDFTYISGGAGNDTVNGSAAADLFYGGTFNDRLLGNAGNDTLVGEAGLDILLGGDGDDWLQGGAGVDTITGGIGVDRFYYESPSLGGITEVITDFTKGSDLLVFDATDLGLSVGAAPLVNSFVPVSGDSRPQFYYTGISGTADIGLYWDSNGIVSGGTSTIARISGGAAAGLASGDFLLI